MKVSIIVPAYNEEKYIAACIESLLDQEVPADEILIINNNSTDDTVAIAKRYPVRIITETIQGMIPARNRGFNEAQYDIIARTDSDARVPRDWIKQIKAHFKDGKLVAVSGPARFYDGLPDIVQVRNWPANVFFEAFKQAFKHDFLFGPNMALRKKVWEKAKDKVCMNDKDVHEDIDLSLHLITYGKILFDRQLVVSASFRRWKKLTPYIEYPYRSIKTIRRHKETLLEREGKKFVRRVIAKHRSITTHLRRKPIIR